MSNSEIVVVTRTKNDNSTPKYVAVERGTGRTIVGRDQEDLATQLGVHRSQVGRAASGEYEFIATRVEGSNGFRVYM